MNFRAKTFDSEFGIRNPEFPDSTPPPRSAFRTPHLFRAFTLIELLVVVAIIGLLAAIGLPGMRGMTRSNAIIAANRQFLDDLGLARQSAVADHTTVYVLFVPTNITSMSLPTNQPLYTEITNLYTARYTTYALFELRQLGEQPGHATPRYITGWRTLPPGIFVAAAKFAGSPQFAPFPPTPTGLPLPCPCFPSRSRRITPCRK